MMGAVLAQRHTGAAINVHPGRHPDQPQEVADFVRVKGGRMDRLIISHIDRTIFDAERLHRLADAGAVSGQGALLIAAGLLQKVRALVGSAPQSDDIAILAMKVKT